MGATSGRHEVVPAEKLALGIEIGATKCQAAVGNADGRLLETMRLKVDLEKGAPGILAWLEECVAALLAAHSETRLQVAAIVAGFGGIVESATGRVLTSVQVSGWQDFPLKAWFEKRFALPCVVMNDTVTAGYGEHSLGSGRGSKYFFYTNIGSGIGGALMIDGKSYDGQGYGAAYFGHTFLPDWTANAPGGRRKVEDLCSGWAIERRLRTADYVPAQSGLMRLCQGKIGDLTCAMLGQAAKEGDAFALQEIDRVAWSLGTGLSNVVTLFSPDCVSIGGGVSNLGDVLLEPVRRVVDESVFLSARRRYRIVQSVFGDEVVLVGAVVYGARGLAWCGGAHHE